MKVPYSESEANVIEALKKNPSTTVAQLIAKHQSRSTVRNALIKAQANGNLVISPEWPRRYSWIDIPQAEKEPSYAGILKPDNVRPADFGKKLRAGVPNLVKVLNSIDPSKQDREDVMKNLKAVGSAVLGLYVALSKVEEGPEWRKEAGV